jgi:hypothetical protein
MVGVSRLKKQWFRGRKVKDSSDHHQVILCKIKWLNLPSGNEEIHLCLLLGIPTNCNTTQTSVTNDNKFLAHQRESKTLRYTYRNITAMIFGKCFKFTNSTTYIDLSRFRNHVMPSHILRSPIFSLPLHCVRYR